jgi:hypothetical protein
VVEVGFAELVPPERVVQQAVFEADDPSYAGTMTMTWHLAAAGDGTEVSVTATDVPPGINQRLQVDRAVDLQPLPGPVDLRVGFDVLRRACGMLGEVAIQLIAGPGIALQQPTQLGGVEFGGRAGPPAQSGCRLAGELDQCAAGQITGAERGQQLSVPVPGAASERTPRTPS